MFSWTIWTIGNNTSYIGGEHDEYISSWFYCDCLVISWTI